MNNSGNDLENNGLLKTIRNMDSQATQLNENLDNVQSQIDKVNQLREKFNKLKSDINKIIDGVELIEDEDCKKKLEEMIQLINNKIKDQKSLEEYKKKITPVIEGIQQKLDESLKKMNVSELNKKLDDFESNMNSFSILKPDKQMGGFKNPKSSKKELKKLIVVF